MGYLFKKHYTREEARALLPQIREWLKRLVKLRRQSVQQEEVFREQLEQGSDLGGDSVNQWIRALAELREILIHFHDRQIQLKDVERGLIDFPSIMAGKEVFLCWEQDEEDIEFWHDLDTGYAGREKL